MKKLLLSLIVLFTLSPAVIVGQVRKPDPRKPAAAATLDDKIRAAIADFKGTVYIYAKNLDTGKDYGLRADEHVRTASTIKLPIMTEVFRQAAEGKLAWTDQIEITKANKVGGSGILGEFSDGSKIDVKTATHLMIVLSDNTATNVLLDKVSSNNVNEHMAKLGLKDTLSLRKIGGGGDARAWDEPLNKLFGIGRSSARDMVRLMEMLEHGQVVSKEASAEMIAILKRQQYKDGLGRNALDTMPVASKSGALDRLRSDVGIVYTRRGRIAMAITVDDMPVVQYIVDDVGNELIWRLSQMLQEGLAK
jgi:beta-lactamase class A